MNIHQIQKKINANLNIQRANHMDTPAATAAREENTALYAECSARGYVYATIGRDLVLFESKERYHEVTNTKPKLA